MFRIFKSEAFDDFAMALPEQFFEQLCRFISSYLYGLSIAVDLIPQKLQLSSFCCTMKGNNTSKEILHQSK